MQRLSKSRFGAFLRKRESRKGILMFLALLAIIVTVTESPAIVARASAERRIPIYCVQREDKAVSLTFDAAWGNEDTQTLIDILGKYGVKATFFVVGAWVDKYPESVKALADAGHEVMNHSDDHAHFSQLSESRIKENVNACCDKIEAVTGVRPTLFRAPYGEYDNKVIDTLDSMGIRTIQWDTDSLDWKDYDAATIYERVTSNVKPGSIVLFHNAAKHTPEALGDIIEFLQANGYKIMPVSELLLNGDYTIDHTGRQCTK